MLEAKACSIKNYGGSSSAGVVDAIFKNRVSGLPKTRKISTTCSSDDGLLGNLITVSSISLYPPFGLLIGFFLSMVVLWDWAQCQRCRCNIHINTGTKTLDRFIKHFNKDFPTLTKQLCSYKEASGCPHHTQYIICV